MLVLLDELPPPEPDELDELEPEEPEPEEDDEDVVAGAGVELPEDLSEEPPEAGGVEELLAERLSVR
ncbi:MAG TPA: hypothetical protein VGX23_37765 [Actinocrinis sp.]|nr:hypothetical protein [Actinocrinis sp.]